MIAEPLPMEQIRATSNDRTRFCPKALRELADSIRENGLIQPITVRRLSLEGEPLDGWQIVAGERRFRALKLLGWTEAPCLIVDLSDEQASALTLSENTARQDLDPIDEARAYSARIDGFGWTLEEISLQAGVSCQRVGARLKLLRLRSDLQGLVRTGDLSLGYAQILADGELDPNRQLLALGRLRDNASPSPAWFRRQVGSLKQEQAQDTMFGSESFELTLESLPPPNPAGAVEPPAPGTHSAPRTGRTAEAQIKAQVEFWERAAADWQELGKPHKRESCLAAAGALRAALEALAACQPKAPRPRRNRKGASLARNTLQVAANQWR